MKMKIWTEAYSPFVMGGDVNAPIMTEVEVGDPVLLDHDVKVYCVTSPSGENFMAEGHTGAFVGKWDDLAEIINDVANASPEVLEKQFDTARERVKLAREIEPLKFWGMFK